MLCFLITRMHTQLHSSRSCGFRKTKCKKDRWEFPLWLSGLRTQGCLCKDAGSISGLPQWVGDPAWSQATSWVAEAARVWWCLGWGIALSCSCSSNSTPGPGTSTCRRCSPKNEKIEKKKKACIAFKMKRQRNSAQVAPWPGCRELHLTRACGDLKGQLLLPSLQR